jgi:hypothetical protein
MIPTLADCRSAILGRRDQLAWLSKQSLAGLKSWLRGYLEKQIAFPLVFGSVEEYPSNRVIELVGAIEDADAKERVKGAVVNLIEAWDEVSGSADYFVELTHVAGEIRATEAAGRLMYLAKQQRLKGHFGMGKELHRHVLQVLFGLRAEHPDLDLICKRDIDDVRYTPLCFRKLYETEYINGLLYMEVLLKVWLQNPAMDIDGILRRFIGSVGLRAFGEQLPLLIAHLAEDRYTDLVAACYQAGYKFLWNQEEKTIVIVDLRDPHQEPLPTSLIPNPKAKGPSGARNWPVFPKRLPGLTPKPPSLVVRRDRRRSAWQSPSHLSIDVWAFACDAFNRLEYDYAVEEQSFQRWLNEPPSPG